MLFLLMGLSGILTSVMIEEMFRRRKPLFAFGLFVSLAMFGTLSQLWASSVGFASWAGWLIAYGYATLEVVVYLTIIERRAK